MRAKKLTPYALSFSFMFMFIMTIAVTFSRNVLTVSNNVNRYKHFNNKKQTKATENITSPAITGAS